MTGLIEEARRIVKLCEHPEMSRSLMTEQYRFAKALLAADAVITKQRNSGVSTSMFPLLVAYDATLKE